MWLSSLTICPFQAQRKCDGEWMKGGVIHGDSFTHMLLRGEVFLQRKLAAISQCEIKIYLLPMAEQGQICKMGDFPMAGHYSHTMAPQMRSLYKSSFFPSGLPSGKQLGMLAMLVLQDVVTYNLWFIEFKAVHGRGLEYLQSVV